MLKYKGYAGIVEYDDAAKVFTGEVMGIHSVISFQGRTPEEIETSFRDSIDIYLAMCKEDGVEPDRPYSGRFNIRISPELHRNIAYHAAHQRKSINEWATETFEKAVKSESDEK